VGKISPAHAEDIKSKEIAAIAFADKSSTKEITSSTRADGIFGEEINV